LQINETRMKPLRHSSRILPLANVLEILALSSFALAQPLFGLLSGNAEFLVAHQSEPLDILLLVLGLCFLPTLFLTLTEILAGIVGPRIQRGVHSLVVAILAAAILLPPLRRIGVIPGKGWVLVAILLAVAFSTACLRFRRLRIFLAFLSSAALLFPLVFLVGSPVRKLIFVQEEERKVAAAHIGAPAPIVMVIFDEFPLTSLLDETGQINSTCYPNFAELSRSATWYRNATTVTEGTVNAVSSILDGKYPDLKLHLVPNAKDHPRSLFSLLGRNYEFKVFETNTRLCPEQLCGDDHRTAPFWPRMRSLLSDLGVLYLYVILPADLTSRLPSISQSWKDFTPKLSAGAQPWAVYHNRVDWSDRPRQFRDFVAAIQPFPKPTLHFLHILLPHAPWVYLPSGQRYTFDENLRGVIGTNDKGIDPNLWTDDKWVTVQAYQRHLLQVEFVDRLLGDLLNHLKSIGLYDSALVLITADHGVSFRPNDSRRRVSPTNYPDILAIPLFIKTPHQQKGAIDDRNVETVDILPTLADILQASIPWKVEGQSAMKPSQLGKTQKTVISEVGKTLVFASHLDGTHETVLRKLELFGPANDANGFFWVGVHKELIGQNVNEILAGQNIPIEYEIDGEGSLNNVDLDGSIVPMHITGRIHRDHQGPEVPLHLAVATHGRIRAVTETHGTPEGEEFSTILPDSAFQPGYNEVRVFAILDRDGRQVLAGLRRKKQAEYKWGTLIDFTSRGNAKRYQAEGWGVPEPAYTWNHGKSARLVLPVARPKSSVTLKVRLSAFVVPGKVEKQTLRILVDNHFAGEWVIGRAGLQDRMLVIPNQLFTDPRETIITFEMPGAVPPNTIGAGGDVRPLAIAVASLVLTQ
jgi:hypothetical protein